MAVSGLPEPCDDHARCIARLALNMLDRARELRAPDGESIEVRDTAGYIIYVAGSCIKQRQQTSI